MGEASFLVNPNNTLADQNVLRNKMTIDTLSSKMEALSKEYGRALSPNANGLIFKMHLYSRSCNDHSVFAFPICPLCFSSP
ncbi:unnamed protein product [Microthlaspi erraticum]|uniref:Uncharacterized protein n=1 Tax=Microthlaspi erraticum TaxID=1685480 RepID=A0A6D2KRC0_9BRAS|nr:unnamed protein product [Microthlaspi erraticum]